MRRNKSKNTGRTVLCVLLALVFIMGCAAAGLYFYVKGYNQAFKPDELSAKEFVVQSGSGTTKIANQLEEAGLIKSAAIFKFKTKFNNLDGKFQAGTFVLSPSMTMKEIMDSLQRGVAKQVSFTIHEGLTLWEIGEELLDQKIIASIEDFYAALEDDYDYDFLPKKGNAVRSLSAKANRLEGYLYPETYSIDLGSSAHVVIDRMLKQFKNVVADEILSDLPKGWSVTDIMTLASMIEKECGVDEERARISGVFCNRINKGMKLQSDVTVYYTTDTWPMKNGEKAHASYATEYNTYYLSGLPHGPICNPGMKSIEAALHPENNEYLYFVLKGDGTKSCFFASTYEEHMKNVEIYHKNLKK